MEHAQSIGSGASVFEGAFQGSEAPLVQPFGRDGAIHEQARAMPAPAAEAAITAMLQGFFHALREGDLEAVQAAFQPAALVTCYEGGNCVLRSVGSFLVELAGIGSQRLDTLIQGIDTVGNVAHAYVEIAQDTRRSTHFLSLEHDGADWRIAGLSLQLH